MIKNLLEKFKTNYKDYLKNHALTNAFLLITIILIIFHNETETANKALMFSISTSIFTLFTECFTKKRTPLYVISIILGLLIGAFSDNDAYTRIILGFLLTTMIGIIYLMMKNSKTTSDKYITQAFTNLFKIGIMGLIINIGIMLVVGLFSGLIYELDYDVFIKLEFIIIITYFIPAGIISLEKIEQENTKFIYVINNYILLPLVGIATAIFYLYIIKLIITLKLPETSIFAPIAALLIFGIPTVLMVLSYEEKNIFNKIADKLRYLFIPLLVLQTYAITLRIAEHSITESRYMGVLVLIIGISAVILLIKEKKNFKLVLIPCILLTVISTMVPYINIEEFPNYMQIKRLKKIMPEGTNFVDLTKEQQKELLSIVYYVDDEKYYPSYIDRSKFAQKYYNCKKSTYIYYNENNKKIKISNYEEMEKFYSNSYNGFNLKIGNINYNIEEYAKNINDYYSKNHELERYMEENNVINISENIDIYITNLSLRYDEEYISIEGYILYKGE